MTIETLKENSEILSNTVLRLLLTPSVNAELIPAFQTFAPSISNEILTASVNETCSCRNKIKNYIKTNSDSVAEFIFDYVNDKNISDILDSAYDEAINLINLNKATNLSGKVAKTTMAEWGDFASKLEGVMVRNFSVVKEGEDVYVFFL
jgi:hypothetical protein